MRQLLIITFLFLANQVIACRCNPMTLEEEIERSSHIFSGIVVSQKGYLNTIKIIDSWKGNLKDTFILKLGTTSCHKTNLTKDKKYLIFLDKEYNAIHNCSRTTELKFTQDIDNLNKIFKNKNPQTINGLTTNEIDFINAIFSNSEIETLKELNDFCTFFIYQDNKSAYRILTIEDFIKFEHYGAIPLLIELDSKNKKMTLFGFTYGSLEFIKPKKSLRAFRKNKKDTGCNKS